MYWNHRVVRHVDDDGGEFFDVREIFYNDDGTVVAWTKDGVGPGGSTLEELKADHVRIGKVLDIPALERSELPEAEL